MCGLLAMAPSRRGVFSAAFAYLSPLACPSPSPSPSPSPPPHPDPNLNPNPDPNQSVFKSLDDFHGDFGTLTDADQIDKLNEKIRPYLLRRQKGDVEKSLAPLEETIIWVEMTLFQKKCYKVCVCIPYHLCCPPACLPACIVNYTAARPPSKLFYLQGDSRGQPRHPGQRCVECGDAEPRQHPDGAAQVLQPPLPDQGRRGVRDARAERD